ncbi:uncharacterized protein [Anabrus simplex]|uniref:uncharacterized protein n=1 Tax=Anabrus simplex TaxID=316456 RepID=UPI0035A27E21
MVFQKRNTGKDSSESKEGKSKMSDRANKRSASKSDILKPNKQPKEDKKSMEESSVSSEDLSNDMTPVNRSSDDSEGGSVPEMCGSGNSSGSSISDSVSSNLPNKKSNLTKIPFEPGLRLEAKDLGNEIWYSVKVVEVDWEEEEILIHFEKWSQRYDEWISMDSSRLRPIQEPVPTKANKKGSKVFKVGDTVNATWSDSRKYPATVKAVLSGDKYEVLFMDGYTKIIKGARMARMKESDMLNAEQFDPEKLGVFKVPEKPPAPPVLSPLITDTETIGTKAERRERKRKLNVAELFHVKKRPRKSPPSSSPSTSKPSESETGRTLDEKRKESHHQKQEESEREDKQKQREKRQKRPSSDGSGDLKGSELESTPSQVEPDVKPVTLEPTVAPETVKPVEEETKKDESDTKVRRKIIPKLRDRDEEEIKPRRRMKRDRTEAGGRSNVRKGMLAYKMNRKLARKGLQDRKDQSYSTENVDTAVPGTSQESTETPKTKKREVQEGEVEKPSRKSALDGWEPEGEPAYIVESAEGLRKSIIVSDIRLPEGWIKHMIQRKGGHSAGKWDVFFVCPQGRKFRSRHELRNYFEEKGEEFPREQFDFSLGRRKMRWTARDAAAASKASLPGQLRGIGRGKPPVPSTSEEQPVRRVKTLLPKVRVPQAEDGGGGGTGPDGSSPRSPLPPYTTTVAPLSAGRLPDEGTDGGVLVGSLKIQMENDAFMCPKDGCNKHFRKENLLQMHIKHYHPEYNKFMGSTPNVADLAYARTIGEPVEDLIPKARYSVASPTFLEKINRFEANRKAKNLGVSVPTGLSPTSGGAAAAPDFIPVERKKSLVKDMKPGLAISNKKTVKAEIENSSSESSSAAEDAISVTARQEENPPVLEPALTAVREERKEQQPTIRTLLPVVRTAAPAQELTLAERLKMHCPSEDSLGDAVLRKDQLVAPQSPQQPSQTQPPVLQQQTPLSSQLTMPHLTKSMRTVRRKHMSDFHMEPLMRKRKAAKAPDLMPEDADLNEDSSLHSDSSTYRYSRKKLPVVHLEKLQTTMDSNGHITVKNLEQVCARYQNKASLEGEDRSKSPLLESPAKTRVEQLRREEIINCICGYNEEDGLMIQCDLCLCWQHGLCSKIEKETDVPEKYVCPICVNPPRERRSKHYIHDQDWLKEGTLPSFSFRSKNLENIKQREMVLKRTHELTATLHQLNQVIHSLRVKVNIAEAPDQHPKLYLWAKSWEDDDDMDSSPQVPTPPSGQNFKREAKPLPDPVLQSLDHQAKLEMSSEHSYGEQLKPDLGSFDSLPLLHAFGKEVKTELTSQPHTQEQKKHGELVQTDKDSSEENGTESTKQDTSEAKVDENWSGSFSSRNLSYPLPPSAMEEDMCSVSSAEPSHVNLSEDEHTSPEPMSLDPSEEQSASSNLLNLNPSEEEVPSPTNTRLPLSEDEEPVVDSPTKEGFEPAVNDADTKDTEMSVDSTGNSETETKKDISIPQEVDAVKESKSEPVQKDADKEMAVDNEQPQEVLQESVENIVEPLEEMVQPAEEIVEAAEETVESQPILEPTDSMVETVEELIESREEVVESAVENVAPVEETVDSQKGNPEPTMEGRTSTEEVAKPSDMQNGLENCNPSSPAHVDSHILHQVLTNGISSINSEDAVDTQNMLQLPLCQSELMQLATSIADNLEEAEPVRPQLQEPVPEALIDPNECRTRLLDHIENYHQQIESRLTTIEAQIAALESMDPHSASDEAADYYPQTKQTVQMLLRDLQTLRRISAFN